MRMKVFFIEGHILYDLKLHIYVFVFDTVIYQNSRYMGNGAIRKTIQMMKIIKIEAFWLFFLRRDSTSVQGDS